MSKRLIDLIASFESIQDGASGFTEIPQCKARADEEDREVLASSAEIRKINVQLEELTDIQTVLKSALGNECYDPQMAAFVNASLERFTDMCALPNELSEYYQVSFEGIGDIKKKLKQMQETLAGKINRAATAGTSDELFYKNLKTQVGKASIKLNSFPNDSVEVSIRGLGTYLGHNGEFVDDIPAAIKLDISGSEFFLESFVKDYLVFIRALIEKPSNGDNIDEVFEVLNKKNPIRNVDRKYVGGDVWLGHNLKVYNDYDNLEFTKEKVKQSPTTLEIDKKIMSDLIDGIKAYTELNRRMVGTISDITKIMELYKLKLNNIEIETITTHDNNEGRYEETSYYHVVNEIGEYMYVLISFLWTMKSKNRQIAATLYYLVERTLLTLTTK